MIDIVTVVFDDEIPVLKLQAQSIDLYCRDIGVRSIYVMVNDHESVAEQIDTAWWGEFADCVTVLPRRIFSSDFVSNGWVSQQVLKILAASISHNTWSMVMDAKTIFVRNLDLTEIADSTGRICSGTLLIQPVFEPSRIIVNNFYGIELEKQIGPGGVPFFFHNTTIRHMIADAEERTQTSFPIWFQSQGRLTEFILYSGYVKYKHGGFNTLYSTTNNIQTHNICHSEVAMFDHKLSQTQLSGIQTIGVHRNAWTQLSADQQQRYRSYLISRRISHAKNL
jgi:hypothetical protein